MLKLKYLRHPLRTASVARALVATHWNVRRLAARGSRRFRNDDRYDLRSVSDGFEVRAEDDADDEALLERICTAYVKATEQQPLVNQAYAATNWWKGVQQGSLAAVRQALATRDLKALLSMYQNFFRDPCSAGLIGMPINMSKAYFGGAINDLHRRFFLGDALYSIDHWKAQTGNRFALQELAGPGIGNPFGARIDGTLVHAGAAYQHYCAHRIGGLPDSDRPTIAEIGGGFGGMAYYLLRDFPAVIYFDFDVPESIALTSYYLLKSFPTLKFLLYGEEELTLDSKDRFNAILMPVFELAKLGSNSVDMTFSSHAMSDLSQSARAEYMRRVRDITRNSFLFIGSMSASRIFQELIHAEYPSLRLVERLSSDWNCHKVVNASEEECLYRVFPWTQLT